MIHTNEAKVYLIQEQLASNCLQYFWNSAGLKFLNVWLHKKGPVSHRRSPKTSDSKLRADHVRAEIGPQENNETIPRSHNRQTRGRLFQVSTSLPLLTWTVQLHLLVQLTAGVPRVMNTVTGDVAVIADIFKRTRHTAPLSQKQVRISAGSSPLQNSNCVLWQEKHREHRWTERQAEKTEHRHLTKLS